MTTLGQAFPGNEVVETAIPDDIMRTARELVGEPNLYVSEPAAEEMTQVIARAILQERERCAKVAEDLPVAELVSTSASSHIMTFGVGATAQRNAIVAAILEGGV